QSDQDNCRKLPLPRCELRDQVALPPLLWCPVRASKALDSSPFECGNLQAMPGYNFGYGTDENHVPVSESAEAVLSPGRHCPGSFSRKGRWTVVGRSANYRKSKVI